MRRACATRFLAQFSLIEVARDLNRPYMGGMKMGAEHYFETSSTLITFILLGKCVFVFFVQFPRRYLGSVQATFVGP